jgi:hypothetical protein
MLKSRWTPIVFFLLGFVFDAFMLRRIDELAVLLQQAAYLVISALLISLELREIVMRPEELVPPRWIARVWKYREALLHFLLGTLLNSYTIFYFKSASALTSLAFIFLLALLLVLNEFKRFGESQTRVHVTFWSLCLTSYFATLSPILLGFMGWLPFLLGVGVAALVFLFGARKLRARLALSDGAYRRDLWGPFAAVQATFVLLYFLHVIPPVTVCLT